MPGLDRQIVIPFFQRKGLAAIVYIFQQVAEKTAEFGVRNTKIVRKTDLPAAVDAVSIHSGSIIIQQGVDRNVETIGRQGFREGGNILRQMSGQGIVLPVLYHLGNA